MTNNKENEGLSADQILENNEGSDADNVLKGELEKEKDVDKFLEENYDELEKAIDLKAEELGIKKTSNSDKKSAELSSKERKHKENWLKQMHIRNELDEIIGEAVDNHDPHFLHEYVAFILGSAFITLGFLYDKVFFTFYVIGMLVTLKSSLQFLGENDTRLVRIIRNHPFFYILGGVLFLLMFMGAGYSMPVVDLSLTELVVSTALGV